MLMMRGRAGGQGAHHRGFVSLWGPGGRASAASVAPERVSGGRISKDAGNMALDMRAHARARARARASNVQLLAE